TRRPYEWFTIGLDELVIEELPAIAPHHLEALGKALEPWCPPRPVYVPDVAEDAPPVSDKRMLAFARKVLGNEAQRLEHLAGGRNGALYAATCKLGRYVHHRVLSFAEVEAGLVRACKVNGYLFDHGLSAARKTISSGLRKSKNDRLPVLRDRHLAPPGGEG